MLPQFRPQYIGLAHPFTWPAAVGGIDIIGQERWRRPTWEEAQEAQMQTQSAHFALHWPGYESETMAAAAEVKIFELTRRVSQRVEGQYRRHWGFVPALWNLRLRNEINMGISLKSATHTATEAPAAPVEQDAAVAAANLYVQLTSGVYIDNQGKRRKVDGDTSKLMYAIGVTPLQKRLLADFRFRTRLVPGTREIRSKIGHIGFWATVVYGDGIFMTVSPSERHNDLAIRLSRYRTSDPD